MKKIIYVVLLTPSLLFAQAGQWTWMKGSNVAEQPGTYGALGVEAASNIPGARYEAGSMRDAQNNFWLFAGSGYDHHNPIGILNDLWKYNPSTNNWTWMSGDSVRLQQSVYGVQGVPSPTNIPGERYAFVTWDEANGALWLFGGDGPSLYNDLWKYDLTTGEWTWMTGSNAGGAIGTYGTKGIPAVANTPGGRYEVTCSWTDNNGNFWLFGGWGNASNNLSGDLNDLWMYNPGTNEWTWVSGDNVTNQTGIYGTLGVASPINKPGGRQAYNPWIDSQNNLWLFSGESLHNSDYYNDLWKFNIAASQWTWMGGSNVGLNGNTGAAYGTKNVGDSLNIPSRRFENKAHWVDNCGNFWTYGGGLTVGDLWSYNPSNHQWTWVSGDSAKNTVAVYGTQGVSNAANKPGARFGAPSWKHTDGSLWMFGGGNDSRDDVNDLWRYVISSSSSSINFQASDSVLCANDCINFTDLSINATSWQWSFPGGTPASSTVQNPQNICYLGAGAYNVSLVAGFAGGCSAGTDSLTFTNYIVVNPAPPTPNITQSNDTLFCTTDTSYTSYQWFAGSAFIPGATDTFLVINQSGNYNIEVTNENGCSIAVGITIAGIEEFASDGLEFTVFPNPAGDWLTITENYKSEMRNPKLTIYNVIGGNIYQSIISNQQSVINVSGFASGVYFVQIVSEKERWMGRFVKE